jgi:NitT/TauT family transport system substrate-binding protein
MAIMQTRRDFLTAMSGAGALGLFSAPRVLAAEGPLETTSVRLFKSSLICSAAPQYAAEELLRAEGFKEIAYVEVPRNEMPQAFADGAVDFSVTFAVYHIQAIDHQAPITILAGVHGGCYELFAREGIGSITELKGKQVGLQNGSPALLKLMAAQVGLDPEKDLQWVIDPKVKPLDLFVAGKIDAFLGFPPEPQELRARHAGHVILDTTVDRPWSQYFCCMLAGQPGLRPSVPNRDQARAARHPQGDGPLRHRTGGGCATAHRRRFYSALRLCPANAERQPLQMEGI